MPSTIRLPKMMNRSRPSLAATLLSAIALAGSAHAADGTWTQLTTGGLWSNTANWSAGVADGSGSTADFSTLDLAASGTGITVNLDGDRTLTNLKFGDTTPSTARDWILANGGTSTNNLILAGATPTITVNAMGTGKSATISAIIEGSSGLTKDGVGTLTLTGANTFSGGLSIKQGAVALGTSGSAAGTGTITLGDSIGSAAATLTAGGSGLTFSNNIQLGATSGALTIAGNSANGGTYSGTITGTHNLIIGVDRNSASANISFSAINNTGTVTTQTVGAAVAGTSVILGAESLGSNVTGLIQNSALTSTVLLGANTAFIGDTTVTAGTLNVRNSTALQNSVLNMNGGSVTFGTSTTVAITSVTLGGLSGSGNLNLNNTLTTPTAVALTLGNSNASYGGNTLNPTYSGVLSNTNGAASLTKVGTNTQTLSGANSYTGATSVTGGTLLINGTQTLATGAVSVASGATLGGLGTVAGATTINAGGFLATGSNAIGTQNFSNGLTINGTQTVEIGATSADKAAVTGALTLGAASTLALTNGGSAAAGSYQVITNTVARTGTFNSVTNAMSSTLHETVVHNTNDVTVNLFRLASASAPSTTVNLGNVRTGGTLTGSSASIVNTAATDGFSETLKAVVTGNGTGFSGVTAGNSSSVGYSLATSVAGAQTGSATVALKSTGVGSYGDTTLSTTTVALSGTAYDFASASFSSNSINFGTVNSGQTYTATFLLNAASGTRDNLSGTFTLSDGALTSDNISSVSNLVAGDNRSITLRYLAGGAGAYSGSLTFNGTSNGAALGLDNKTLAGISYNISATVMDVSAIPEPATYATLAGLGILILAAYRRRKTS